MLSRSLRLVLACSLARRIERFLFEKPKLTHVYLFTVAKTQCPCGLQPIEVRLFGDIGELVRGLR